MLTRFVHFGKAHFAGSFCGDAKRRTRFADLKKTPPVAKTPEFNKSYRAGRERLLALGKAMLALLRHQAPGASAALVLGAPTHHGAVKVTR
jgi:hypothetical protein